MTEAENLALEADRILRDDTINSALTAMRSEALETLVSVDATGLVEAQAMVKAIDNFRDALKAMILRKPQKPRAVA